MEAIFGNFRYEIKFYSSAEIFIITLVPKQFFPQSTSTDLEAQKILDQKYHSTLENNSLKGGDIGQKMSKSHKNIHVSLGFPLKIKIVLKIQELLDFQWQP